MVQAISVAVDPRPPSARALSPVTPSPSFPPDVIRLLDVLARIELRRQTRLRELRGREAS